MIRNSPFIRCAICRFRYPSKPIPCHENLLVHGPLYGPRCYFKPLGLHRFHLTPLKNTILLKFIQVTFFLHKLCTHCDGRYSKEPDSVQRSLSTLCIVPVQKTGNPQRDGWKRPGFSLILFKMVGEHSVPLKKLEGNTTVRKFRQMSVFQDKRVCQHKHTCINA